ncbi:Sec63 Brl domain-containing protein [Suillus bovinus]|uniref:Sec63 Brl domain-containing protein n=1 Tax=Suillus bovinus TaxID=48563 RepID=UPI001B872416|nr:Sec63 Brl domain-containing protein [Suillus bovinus]KAG2146850.1 Sec63 Brl domain-containing protein [Suillus bovinus]
MQQPRRWSLRHQRSGMPPLQQHQHYYDDFARSEDDFDSSPSPPERFNDRARAFASHPPASHAFHSGAAQPYLEDYESITPEYTPSPVDYTGMQVQSQAHYDASQSIHHPHQYYGETHYRNSDKTTNNFGSNYDTVFNHRPGGHTQQKHQSVRLRPVSELPDMFRSMFKFGVFNAVQSTCFDAVLYSNENMVISAPTGSGKTVIFELSIIRMVNDRTNEAAKCVYVAPTKALCTEKYKEWTTKFGSLGIPTCELTGDTVVFGKGVWGDAKNARIIMFLAEKWDSLTRNWSSVFVVTVAYTHTHSRDDHSRILSQIKLFLVDEVHILNESRGSTLEVVVSRMKARGSNVRFLLVSATVPNIEDVASWIGSKHASSDHPGQIFQFGDEYRPCRLTRFIYGVIKPKGQNDFAYAHTLDARLFAVLQQHAVDKPILVFCPTRKGTITTARQLAKEYEETMKAKKPLPWSMPLQIDQTFHDKDLAPLAALGIGVHHAGLTIDDRKTIEDLYLRKVLRVLLATSTLAVGVNLPAHLVVIKGVKLYQNGESKEYSDLDIMQMMGRAGRPQFDTEGVAVILCETELERKYRDLIQGTTPLESSLHTNLTEHLNSEIGLGTITDVKTAQEWLLRSFLYRRIQKNPQHYNIGKDDRQSWQDKVDSIVMDSIEQLRETELVTYSPSNGELSSTEFGDIMSRFYIRHGTMKAILDLSPTASLREILEMISASEELSDLKLRSGEKQVYEKIRRHNDVRFAVKKIQGTSDKVFLLIQAVLGGLSLNSAEFRSGESQPCLEAFSVFRHVGRIAMAVAEVAIIKKNGAQVKHGLELVRCLHAKAWEDRPIVLKQLEYIGEKSIKILAENHISSIPKLLSTSPLRLEELLSRRSPFGSEVLLAANELPRYFLTLTEVKVSPSDGKSPVDVELSIECGLLMDKRASTGSKKHKRGGFDMTTLFTMTSDFVFIDFRRISTRVLREGKSFIINAQLTRPSQTINVSISSEKIAGVTVTESFKPSLPTNKYPTLNTRPMTSLEMDLEGLEDVADFWDMGPDDEDELNLPVKDLTRPRSPLQSSTSTRNNTNHHKEKTMISISRPTVKGNDPSMTNTPVRNDAPPKKRSDGKYDCNHTCKDKSACRHFCCRDGLTGPSRVPRKNTKPVHLLSAKKAHDSSIDLSCKSQATTPLGDVPIPKRQKTTKRDLVLEQRNSLHTGADANRKLGLSEGQRLKQDAPAPLSRKRKLVPNFDIELVTLKCSQSPPSSKDLLSDSQSDNDLANIYELLCEGKDVRSKDHSSSEIDALVRDDDTTMDALSKTPSPTRKRACDSLPPNNSTPRKRLKSDNTPYRPYSPRQELANDGRHPKHFKSGLKLFGSPYALLAAEKDDVAVQSTDRHSLYLAESLNVDVGIQSPFKAPLQQPSDDFFDESYFDILPEPHQAVEPSLCEDGEKTRTHIRTTKITRSSAELQATASQCLQPSRSQPQSGIQSNTTNRPYPPPPVSLRRTSNFANPALGNQQTNREMKTNDTAAVDVLAEFESWLDSGAVDIV